MKKISKKNNKTVSNVFDDDDAPLTDAELATGRPLAGKELAIFEECLRRGRPAGRTKEVTSMSFDKDVLAHLRMRKGWQTWVNSIMRATIGLETRAH